MYRMIRVYSGKKCCVNFFINPLLAKPNHYLMGQFFLLIYAFCFQYQHYIILINSHQFGPLHISWAALSPRTDGRYSEGPARYFCMTAKRPFTGAYGQSLMFGTAVASRRETWFSNRLNCSLIDRPRRGEEGGGWLSNMFCTNLYSYSHIMAPGYRENPHTHTLWGLRRHKSSGPISGADTASI